MKLFSCSYWVCAPNNPCLSEGSHRAEHGTRTLVLLEHRCLWKVQRGWGENEPADNDLTWERGRVWWQPQRCQSSSHVSDEPADHNQSYQHWVSISSKNKLRVTIQYFCDFKQTVTPDTSFLSIKHTIAVVPASHPKRTDASCCTEQKHKRSTFLFLLPFLTNWS